MACKNYIISLLVFLVLVIPSIFLNGYTVLHKSILLSLEILSGICFLLKLKDLKLSSLSVSVLVIFFYFLFNIACNSFFYKWPVGRITVTLLESLWWLIAFLCTYLFSQLNLIKINMLNGKIMLSVFFLVSLLVLSQAINGKSLDFYTSNFGYLPLCFMPFIFLLEKRKLKILCLFLVLICVSVSLKRTAIIAFFVTIALIAVLRALFSPKKKIVRTFAIAIIAIISVNYMNTFLDGQIVYRLSSSYEDGGSGRIYIYQAVLKSFDELSFDQKIFGRGHNMVRGDKVYGLYRDGDTLYLSAHNDFLEVLYDYGVCGFVLYMYFLFNVLRLCFYWMNKNEKYFCSMLSCSVIIITMSLFSHLVIYPTYMAYFSMLCAFLDNEKNKLELING